MIGKAAIPALVEARKSKDAWIRYVAFEVLGMMGRGWSAGLVGCS